MIQSVDDLYDRLKSVKVGSQTCVFTREKCEEMWPVIQDINRIKKEKNALILAHSYVSPELLLSVADFTGDSYELSRKARESDADIIVFCAVKFMAETAKLLNPAKRVFIPTSLNGCTLADSITGADVRKLRQQYPDFSFVCYINTTMEVKAECDVCVTSSNVYRIIEQIPNQNIYFLPDKLMAQNIIEHAKAHYPTKVIKYWGGACYVHEDYDADMVRYLKSEYDSLAVLAHPECSPEVVEVADFVGSTSQMLQHVKQTDASAYFMLTECGLTSRIQLEMPDKKFVGTCTMCRYMKSNSLDNVLHTLTTLPSQYEIQLSPDVQQKALKCINEMFAYNT